MPAALVTGATGMLGRHIVERLVRDGWTVRALVRDPATAQQLDVDLAAGDILDAPSLARAVAGMDVVFHAAAAVTPSGGWPAFQRPNIEGTRNVIDATATVGAKLVHVSSVAIYGSSARYLHDSAKTHEDVALTALDASACYARSKREAEALVLDAHRAGRLWATAVRPDVIYGRYDRQFVPRVARLLRHGMAPVIGTGQTTMAVVHAENVADGIVRAAVTEVAGGRAYNLTNDFDVTVEAFFALAAAGMNRRVRMVRIPTAVAKGIIGTVASIASIVVGNKFSEVSASSIEFLTRDNPFTSNRARTELGWSPRVRPEVGIPDAFRHAGGK